MDWEKTYGSKIVTMEEAMSEIRSGDRIFAPGGSGVPVDLLNTLARTAKENLKDVNVHSCLLLQPLEMLKPDYIGHLTWNSFFMSPLEKKFKAYGNIQVASVPFSRLDYYLNHIVRPNVLIMEVTEPDEEGYVNYSIGGIATNEAARATAELVIAQVNKSLPYVYGESNKLHISKIDYICVKERSIAAMPNIPTGKIDQQIAEHILPYIPDGATIQIGLGGIANAVGYSLEEKKDLGVHSEMLTDSLIYLTQKGVINCSKKSYLPDKVVAGVFAGKPDYYQYFDRNPLFHIAPIQIVNNPYIIARNDNMISINNGLLADLTGQVASEAYGYSQISGTGGQLDFVRGASMSKGGKSFIAFSSLAESEGKKQSRIVLSMPPGTAVTVPRSEIQYVVTEYGVADLYNRSIPSRVRELIRIAHPDFREQLTEDARKVGLI